MRMVVTLQKLMEDKRMVLDNIRQRQDDIDILKRHYETLCKLIQDQCTHLYIRTNIDNGPYAREFQCQICGSMHYS